MANKKRKKTNFAITLLRAIIVRQSLVANDKGREAPPPSTITTTTTMKNRYKKNKIYNLPASCRCLPKSGCQ